MYLWLCHEGLILNHVLKNLIHREDCENVTPQLDDTIYLGDSNHGLKGYLNIPSLFVDKARKNVKI